MKRSRTVALTLLAPAMVAFGCGQPAPPMNVPQAAGEQVANDCDVPAKPGEPEKVKCPPRGTGGHTTSHHSGYYHRPSYGRSSYSDSTVTPTHPTSSSTPSSSSSHVSRGGFGGLGSFFSGGS